MPLRDPREIERQVDEHRTEMERVLALSDEEMPQSDRRDTVMRITGMISELEVTARELREHELEMARAAVETGTAVGGNDAARAEQISAFRAWAMTGQPQAALETVTDANGGVLMPDPIRQTLVDVVRKMNPIMAKATVFTLSKPGTFEVELPRKTGVSSGGWVSEKQARPGTGGPTFGTRTLKCFEWYANPEATQTALDAIDGAEQLIIDDVADTFAEVTGTAFVSGDGNEKPDGLFAGTSFYTTKLSSTSNAHDAAQFLAAYFALPAKFLPTAEWYANGATFAALSGLAWPNLADTPLVRWENGVPTIMGKACNICDDAPAIGDGNFPTAFGDVRRGYAVGVHSRITTLRDPYSNKPYVSFYTTARTGGTYWDPKAVLLLKSDNA